MGLTLLAPPGPRLDRRVVLRGPEEAGGHALAGQAQHLVLHQRDERADHHHGAARHHGRVLVDQALPATCRGDQKESVFGQ